MYVKHMALGISDLALEFDVDWNSIKTRAVSSKALNDTIKTHTILTEM